MANKCRRYHNPPYFAIGEVVISLVDHPPHIKSGEYMTIVSHRAEKFYAVLLSNGELHRWFAQSELKPLNAVPYRGLDVGDCAVITNTFGHDLRLQNGMIVKIAKVISDEPIYDVRLTDGNYHRWLADFELAHPIHYTCAENTYY